jgi:hypothetical protein
MSLPTEVYYVERTPPENERIPYYGRSLSRLYRDRRGVGAFTAGSSHKRGSAFRVWRATVTWEEVEQ